MAFFHGIQVSEKQTQIVAPVQVDSAVQVVVGLAPVNMGNLSDPLAPQIAYNYEEAVEKMGMSADHLTYTICESIKLSFATYNVSPLIMINVLDPTKHKQQKTTVSVQLLEGKAQLPEEGVLLPSVQLTQTEEALTVGEDYLLSFAENPVLDGCFEVKLPVNFTPAEGEGDTYPHFFGAVWFDVQIPSPQRDYSDLI